MEFTYTVAKKIKAPVLNPPKSSMFFPPSYVFLRRNHQPLTAVTSKHPLPLTVTTTISNNGGFSVSTAPSPTFHGSPWFSMLIELVDWPGAMPTTHHLTSTSSSPSGHCAQEMSLNATHIRTCTRLSSSTHGSLRPSLTAQFLSYRHYHY